MDLRALRDTPPWDWPEGVGEEILGVLRDVKAAEPDRLLAAELAGDLVVIDDELVAALQAVLCTDLEPEQLRAEAAISLGPVLELADTDGFEDPDVPITEESFQAIQETFRALYLDARAPKEVRRRVLEASVRAPQDWHVDAIRSALGSGDEKWKLSAVFCMRFVGGFDAQILEALGSDHPDVLYQAVCAAGVWELDAAYSRVSALVRSETTDKPLRLAAIEAVGYIRPQDAPELLADLTDSDDEDIAEAAHEALTMAEWGLDDDEEERLR